MDPAPPTERPISVVIVEDEAKILRNQLNLLKGFSEITVVGQATSGTEAVERIAELRPDVVLLDLGLPGLDGIQVTTQVKARFPGTEVLIFTIFDDETKVLAAIRAGASGYLLKGMEARRIVDAILEVSKGGSVVQPQLARRLLRHFQRQAEQAAPVPPTQEPVTALSPREQEILQLIAKGLSNSQVATAIGVSRATVRTHLEHIYAKLEVSNRTEAVTEGIKQGLIDL
jgi:DNA-binding NarL/FixJ family response regulator